MVGAYYETEETIREASNFCKKHKIKYEPHFMTPFPGTELYEYAKEKGLIKDELEYIKKLSLQGNTNHILVNITKNFSDEEILKVREKHLYFPPTPAYYLILKYGYHILKKSIRFLKQSITFQNFKNVLIPEGTKAYILHMVNEIQFIFKFPKVYRGNPNRHSNIWS